MDAKPQRPLRSLRLRDENIAPGNTVQNKSIHQRNKSSPALSTLATNGTFKTGVKRTAFADVSNTVRNVQLVKDDSSLYGKGFSDAIREGSGQENSKPAELQRPAQRPLSVAGIKGFLNTFTSNNGPVAQKPKLVDIALDSSQAQGIQRKFPIKRSTVFKEIDISATETTHPPAAKPIAEYPYSLPQEPLRRVLGVPDHAAVEPPVPQHQLTKSNYAPVIQYLNNDWQNPLPPIPSEHNQGSTAATIPNTDRLKTQVKPLLDSSEIYQDASAFPIKESESSNRLEKMPSTSILEVKNNAIGLALPVSEVDECWEYGPDEADYEEEGYTTARSLKSRGDYTTGATTIIMAPKMTSQAEKELAAARQIVEQSRTSDDEDDESWDTSMVAEYGEEIFGYMRTLEERMRPNPHYMESQTEVQWSMRSVLMDWLVQVHHRFSLLPETLYLCVNYIDRFLSLKVVSLGKLQLVGATAIFVAAKYEEINCPSVQEIVFMVDGGYTVDEILKAERFMLSMLQFELGWPGPMSFLRRISKADDYDLETRTLAKYFLEITIMDERFVASIPSFTAAGAHCLARLMLKKGSWTPAHVYYSNYTYSQLRQLMLAMLSCCEDPQKHHSAVFDKYGDKRFKRASFFVQSEMNRGFQLPPVQREGSFGHRNTSTSFTFKQAH